MSITLSQGGKENPTHNNRRKANWTGHIFHRNCFLQHVAEDRNKDSSGGKDEEEDVNSYWTSIRKGEYTVN